MQGGRYSQYVREAIRRVLSRAEVVRLGLFRHTIKAPDRILVAPTDLRAIDPHICEEILAGRYPLAGRLLETGGKSPFTMTLPSLSFAARLHSFGWLRHMRARKGEQTAASLRKILDSWLSIHGTQLDGIAWDIDIAAQRVISWLSHSPVLLQGADRGFYRRFTRSLAFHQRFLRRMARFAPPGEALFRLRIALALASIAIPQRAGALKRAAQNLNDEFDRQILPDGGHVSRNPRAALELMLDLLPLRQTYMNLGHDVPQKLVSGIDRMYPALRFFRHQDGDLALFNGATATLATELMSVLRYDETSGQTFKALPHSRYHRLSAGRTVIIVDAGPPPEGRLSQTAHAGCLAFEMSSGRHRFIVNAGSPRFAGQKYVQMARQTATHSTVIVEDLSSSRFPESSFLGPLMTDPLREVVVERGETEDERDRLKASHDGYLEPFGLRHERELTLNAAGTIVTGCDRLIGDISAPLRATARFHIHPAIRIEQSDDESALLVAPDGERWLFSSPGNAVLISEDIFFADASGICRSEQLQLDFSVPDKPEIRWFLSLRT